MEKGIETGQTRGSISESIKEAALMRFSSARYLSQTTITQQMEWSADDCEFRVNDDRPGLIEKT
jgi:hypothetical protein